MSGLTIDISKVASQYQPALRRADTGDSAKAYDGHINTGPEILDAAKYISDIASNKFNGSSVQEAENYLRAVLGLGAAPAAGSARANLASRVTSGWKSAQNRIDPVYETNGNVLKITGRSGSADSLDSIYLGKIDTKGYSKLVITVQAIDGYFPWGGKAISFSIDNRVYPNYDVGNIGTFKAPAGKSLDSDSKLINGALSAGEQLVYDISGRDSIHLGARVFIGDGVEMSYTFELQK